MNIDGVTTGIVLDHIKAGKAMQIYNYLHLDKLNSSVAVLQNVKSSKYGKKDIIKIDALIELRCLCSDGIFTGICRNTDSTCHRMLI